MLDRELVGFPFTLGLSKVCSFSNYMILLKNPHLGINNNLNPKKDFMQQNHYIHTEKRWSSENDIKIDIMDYLLRLFIPFQ